MARQSAMPLRGATKDEKGQGVLSPLLPQWERVRVRAPRSAVIFRASCGLKGIPPRAGSQ
ncbi:MAG: hypothetical protein HYX94_07905 [Chloroflexi bacterium]|nr:hypothetical protein [Chloroflexota bacterium]